MYIIIGSTGFLGRYIVNSIIKNTDENIIEVSRNIDISKSNNRILKLKCDISNKDDIIYLYNKTKNNKIKVIFLAAMHHPDAIIKFPFSAWNINITSLAMFLGIFQNIDTLYYSSSEVVYGETKGIPVDESTSPHPVSRYGELKVLAENIVLTAGYNVIRYPVLMGPSLITGRKHFYDEIVDTLANGKNMKMFCDQKRSMLDFWTASELTIRLIENVEARSHKIVNISGDEALSKYDMAIRIAEAHGMEQSRLIPISMMDTSIFKEKRASETLIDNSLIKKILHIDNITMRFE